MNKKLQTGIFIFWILFFLAALYVYFFQPELFYRMTQYSGPGGPFVQPP